MLYFVLGRIGAGKSTHIMNLFEQYTGTSHEQCVLIVPEQYSFESERRLIETLGEQNMRLAEVTSFSFLADGLIKEYRKNDKVPLDDCARIILLQRAVEQVEHKLNLYSGQVKSNTMIKQLLGLMSEMKQCKVSPVILYNTAQSMKPGVLRSKLEELSLIFDAYEALVSQSFFDSYDSLDVLADILEETQYLKNKIVAIDGFRGFTAQEIKVIEQILKQAKMTYVSLCTPTLQSAEDSDVFFHVRKTAETLIGLAKRNNIPVTNPAELSGVNKFNNFPPSFERYKSAELAALENNLYRVNPAVFHGKTQDITLCRAKDIYAECEWVAAKIKALLREENMRCRDIAVISRSKGAYQQILKRLLKKYEVPVFEDVRHDIAMQPLMVLASSAADVAAFGYSTEKIMRALKTGLMGVSTEEIATLENYVLLWQIDGMRWLSDWRDHPDGLGKEMNERDTQVLNEINIIRRKAISSFIKLKKGFETTDTLSMTKALYAFLCDVKAAENLKDFAVKLTEKGEISAAGEQNQVWNYLIELLDKFTWVSQELSSTPKRFAELFSLSISLLDMGTLPGGIDDIALGTADRIRMDKPRAVFIVGANDAVFPLRPSELGMITDKERSQLKEKGVNLADTCEDNMIEERFIAYQALCGAGEKLYVSYVRKSAQGEDMSASELIEEIKAIFPDCTSIDTDNEDDMVFIQGKSSAFERMARLYREGGTLFESLHEVFGDESEYEGKIISLERAAHKSPYKIENTQIAKDLFGKNMIMSPSQLEVWAQCPFRYFCQYALKAKPRQVARLDAAQTGTVLHFVFENLIRTHGKQGLCAMTKAQRESAANALLDEYFERFMGTSEFQSKREMYQFKKLAVSINSILEKLIEEFTYSEFEPVDFELRIERDGEIPMYEIPLDDGVLSVRGTVDRVDSMKYDDKNYIRIIDYKTNGKEFNLSNSLHGLNLQMLVYLFAIWSGGSERYGNVIPSGIFYMALRSPAAKLPRNADNEKIESEKRKSFRMDGMVLDHSQVILGMDSRGAGVFVPASIDIETGEIGGTLISLSQMGKLMQKVNEIITLMARSMYEGDIKAYPAQIKGKLDSCKFCDYKSVCGNYQGESVNEIDVLKHDDMLKILDGGDSDGC